MEIQASLVHSVSDARWQLDVANPLKDEYVRIFRVPGATPTSNGTYWGLRRDGTREPIGGGGTPSSAFQLAVDVTQPTASPSLLQANPVGGTGPYTYEWSIRSNHQFGGSNASIIGPTNGQQITISVTQNSLTLLQVKVTDVNGLVAYNQFLNEQRIFT